MTGWKLGRRLPQRGHAQEKECVGIGRCTEEIGACPTALAVLKRQLRQGEKQVAVAAGGYPLVQIGNGLGRRILIRFGQTGPVDHLHGRLAQVLPGKHAGGQRAVGFFVAQLVDAHGGGASHQSEEKGHQEYF